MTNHLARRGGIWWARLAVPARLRQAAGRREFTQSTRTHELHVAKLVAAVMLAEWRKQLMTLEARVMNTAVSKLLEAAPSLEVGGTVSIDHACQLGVDRDVLLRFAAAGRLPLYCRIACEHGYLVDSAPGFDAVLHYDGATGEREIPPPAYLPASAVETLKSGPLLLPDSKELANAIVTERLESVDLVALQAPGDRKRFFVPDRPIKVQAGQLEVPARLVEKIRGLLAKRLTPDQVDRATKAREAPLPSSAAGKRASALFSKAVESYCTESSGLQHDLTSEVEQRQRRAGMMLFAEFMGDMQLADIQADTLRSFRDGPLKTLPAKANHLPKPYRRPTMAETVKAIAEAEFDWPTMTAGMQHERMQWLIRLFDWLHRKEWIATNPALPLTGETGLTKAARKQQRVAAGDEDETGRDPFSPVELQSIFGQSWFSTGSGAHFSKPRFWYPFEYWLPLLGLYAGCRIGEASQLHLADVRQIDGVWALDINELTPDKSIKTGQSRRHIPLHPHLIKLGFLDYCERLRNEGFRRVFPELTCAKTDARYAKESGRKMSYMLARLGMPRNGQKVFHCLRHNLNNAMLRVPLANLPYADEHLRNFIRYTIMGHELGSDVNARHYLSTRMSERRALIAGVDYELPSIAPLNIDFAVGQVKNALMNKQGERRGREDMGPLNQ
jgi:integrase